MGVIKITECHHERLERMAIGHQKTGRPPAWMVACQRGSGSGKKARSSSRQQKRPEEVIIRAAPVTYRCGTCGLPEANPSNHLVLGRI